MRIGVEQHSFLHCRHEPHCFPSTLLLVRPSCNFCSELQAQETVECFTLSLVLEIAASALECVQELFGPLSMRALEDDRYVRQTEGYLPKANVAFVDEIFKANSAILNTLLTVLNERLFDNGTKRELVPLLCLVVL